MKLMLSAEQVDSKVPFLERQLYKYCIQLFMTHKFVIMIPILFITANPGQILELYFLQVYLYLWSVECAEIQ